MTDLRPTKETYNDRAYRKRAEALADGDIQTVVNELSPKQRAFCEQYLIDYNGSAAALRAGYKTKYPAKLASKMLDNPVIRACIDQITLERAEKSVVKPDYVINKIVKTIEAAEDKNNHTAVLRGCELLARHLGMFIERQEISGPNGDAIKYEQVREAANDFTRAIASILERRGEEEPLIIVDTGGDG